MKVLTLILIPMSPLPFEKPTNDLLQLWNDGLVWVLASHNKTHLRTNGKQAIGFQKGGFV